MPNPNAAPGSEPASRPALATTSGVRSALAPKISICETAATCTSTTTTPSSDQAPRELERRGDHGRFPFTRRVRTWTNSRRRRSAYGLTCASCESVPASSTRVTAPIGMPGG